MKIDIPVFKHCFIGGTPVLTAYKIEYKDRIMDGLWLLYQTKGTPRNISIEQFCMKIDVNYNEFYRNMEFNSKMKSFGCIELLIRIPDGTQIMGNTKDAHHVTSFRRNRIYQQTYLRRIMQVGMHINEGLFCKIL